jgi:LPS-assembly protein
MQPAVPPFARLFLSLCLAVAFAEAHAAIPTLLLKSSGRISPPSAKDRPPPGPTHVEADRIEGHREREIVAEGRVIMSNLRERLEADWLRYDASGDEARARGHVVFSRERDRLEGSALHLKLTPRLGDMKDVRFELYSGDGKRARGEAGTLHFAGVDVYELEAASYTTCPAGDPDWLLKVDDLKLNYVTSVGSARQVRVEYLDVPILYVPWMDFALDDKRKSGFLAPSYGASNERGLELVAPWYWNIAPNRDATLTPRVMTKRGVQLAGDFRYLEDRYGGGLDLEFLPNDQVLDRNRFHGLWRHQQRFDGRWSGGVEFERVSDDAYFADLSSQVSQTSRVNLPQQASLAYDGGWWKASGMVQRFQTLQDAAAPIVEPYHRLPQLTLTAHRERFQGYENTLFDFSSELVYFDHQTGNRVQGARLHAYPRLEFPLQTSYSTVTPRLGWHLTRYALDDATRTLQDSVYAPADMATIGGFADVTRSLPVFSVDSSLLMERDWSFRGRDYIQTLEPRAFYVYIPYKNQDRIPVFDSRSSDLSLDQLFTENQYTGVDRVNDANQLTLALTSRFLDRETGVERLQVTLGQRYYFSDQRVALTPSATPRSANTSDLIAQVSGQITPKWRIGTGLQINADDGTLAKANLGGAYRDGPGRIFNVDYRYTRDSVTPSNTLNQLDLSAQWPLANKWYGLGRINYSFHDHRLVEGLAGFEYNAGCWSLRGVIQQLATTENTATSAFFLQLELHGLTKLGPNPLEVLKRSITGYAKSNEIEVLQ